MATKTTATPAKTTTKTTAAKKTTASATAETKKKTTKAVATTVATKTTKKPAAKTAAPAKAPTTAAAKKTTAPAVKSKLATIKDKLTATQIIAAISERSEVDKKDVKAVLNASQEIICAALKKNGVGQIKIMGWNFKSILKPATKGGEKKPNPFKKGEFIITKPRAASMRMKAMPLKAVKDAINPQPV